MAKVQATAPATSPSPLMATLPTPQFGADVGVGTSDGAGADDCDVNDNSEVESDADHGTIRHQLWPS